MDIIIEDIENQVADLRNFIVDLFKDGRARSLALTKLDECEMWLFKAIHIGETK